jgi:uncharacterized membrane protein
MYNTQPPATSRLMRAVLLLVALLSVSQLARAQLQGLLVLQMKGWITYTPDYIAAQGGSVTYASTATTCFNGGGVPTSDATTKLTNEMRYYVAESGVGAGLSFYIGSSAEPAEGNPNSCIDQVPSTSASPNSANCAYRWRYGYYDLYSYKGEPGTAYWKGLYFTSLDLQVVNQFEQFAWNNTKDAPTRYPRGYYYTINGYGTNSMLRMDVPATPADNDPNPIAKYMVVCEVQLYPQQPATTTRMPQPLFVNGFKTLTWAQDHWWVIFLIVAVVLLVVLIIIIIYCCVTAVKPKEEPPLHAMVLRERVGKAYILAETTQKSNKDSKDNQNAAYLQQQQLLAAQRERELLARQQQQAAEAQRRLGRGFNPQAHRQDPEDMSVGAVGIFGRDAQKQYSDGNVVKDSQHEKSDQYYADVSTGGLREDELENLAEPEPQPQPEAETTSVGPSVTASKRKNTRRSRGRIVSQTFDDVDVPQAGEIDETNVDL